MAVSTPIRKTGKTQVAPAVLVKDQQSLLNAINFVKPFSSLIHIDIMDDKFVPNKTIGAEEFKNAPSDASYEIHWMVESPEKQIEKLKGNHLHLVHIETIKGNWAAIQDAVKKSGGRLGIAINPETPIEQILPYAEAAECFLVMAVHPGFSGQSYIKNVEEKISLLRKKFPGKDIEVDGGIDFETGRRAVKAGANKLASASTIFKAQNPGEAIKKLEKS